VSQQARLSPRERGSPAPAGPPPDGPTRATRLSPTGRSRRPCICIRSTRTLRTSGRPVGVGPVSRRCRSGERRAEGGVGRAPSRGAVAAL